MTTVFYPLPEVSKAGNNLAIEPKKKTSVRGVDIGFKRKRAIKYTDEQVVEMILYCFAHGVTSASARYGVAVGYMKMLRDGRTRRKAWIMAEKAFIKRSGDYPPDRVHNRP